MRPYLTIHSLLCYIHGCYRTQWKQNLYVTYFELANLYKRLIIIIIIIIIIIKVAPLKNLLFLAVLKLDVENSLRHNKEIESIWEKPSLQYKLIIYKHCLACILLT